MTDYLQCGHPVGCGKLKEIYFLDGHTEEVVDGCAACERGGWVYCCPQRMEGLPPIGAAYLDVAFVRNDYTDYRKGHYRRSTPGEWRLANNFAIDGKVYAWRYRPAPPPVPEEANDAKTTTI
jgi:hypothetical protein